MAQTTTSDYYSKQSETNTSLLFQQQQTQINKAPDRRQHCKGYSNYSFSNAVTARRRTNQYDVAITSTIPLLRPIDTYSRPLPLELRLPSLRTTQRTRDRSRLVSRGNTQSADSITKSRREGAGRAVNQQRESQHTDQTSGRNRTHPRP